MADFEIPEGYVLVPKEVYELLVDAARPITITHQVSDAGYDSKSLRERAKRLASRAE